MVPADWKEWADAGVQIACAFFFFSPLFLSPRVLLLPAPDFQFSKHLGLPSLLNMCQTHTKKRNRRKSKAAHYAGIKVKQLSSFWKPILFLIRLLHFLTSSQSSYNIASTLSCSVLGLICSAAFERVPLPPWISIPAFPPVCTWLRSALDWILLSL